MTKDEISELLRRFQILGLLIGAMIHESGERERTLYSIERLCGRPLREFLVEADPEEDAGLYWLAIQAVEALREDQILIRTAFEGRALPVHAREQ